MKTKHIFLLLLFLTSFIFSHLLQAQEQESKFFHITEENLQFFLDKNPLCVIYFYSSYHSDSLKMKKVIPSLILDKNPDIFLINLDTNAGLKKTFNVQSLPSLVVFQNRKLIYGITGYVDEAKTLSGFINQGINNFSNE